MSVKRNVTVPVGGGTSMHDHPAPMETAERIAEELLEGFDRHYELFRSTSARAKEAYEAADWGAVQRLVKERILFYDNRVLEYVSRLNEDVGAESVDDSVWQLAKLIYVGLLIDHKRPELAETFFNSVTTRVLRRIYVHDELMFKRAALSTEYIPSEPPTYRSYYPAGAGLEATFLEVFRDFGWRRPFENLERDVGFVMRALGEFRGQPRQAANFQVQVLGSAFYRNKAAYVIGKIVNGSDETAFVVPVLHDERRARARHDPARAGVDRHPLLALARVLPRRHGRAVGLRAASSSR